MASKVLFDSNIWIAYFAVDDSTHEEARRILDNNDKVIYVPDFILAEAATVLKHKANDVIATKFITMTMNNRDVHIVQTCNYLDAFIKEFTKGSKNKLSFIDVSLLVLSKKEYDVITFDKELLRAIGTHKK